MAAVGVAIVGRNNEPLYVREFLSEHENTDDDALLFGLKPRSNTQNASSKCWFAFHGALDRLEQLTKTLDGKKKTMKSDNKNFVGLLLPYEETRIYGYLTNTQTKILVMVEDETDAEEADTRKLLEEIHELYVREVMNPFRFSPCTEASNQLSQTFDERIQKHIANFNQTEMRYTISGAAEC